VNDTHSRVPVAKVSGSLRKLSGYDYIISIRLIPF
jgi:hypothetical protein